MKNEDILNGVLTIHETFIEKVECIAVKDERECANCGRFNRETHGCGRYVDNCMIDGDAYSNWIPKNI